MHVVVGSTNPSKVQSVRDVFTFYYGQVEVTGAPVSSGVSEQPKSDEEMYKGAFQRATQAIRIDQADFGVGIEGGLDKRSYGCFERSLVVILDRKKRIGIGSSGGLVLPSQILSRIDLGNTLEQAVDDIFGTKKIGEGIGMFGLMTNGYVTRSSGVAHGVAFALSRFLHDDLYVETTV